jgi:hypothetical protein
MSRVFAAAFRFDGRKDAERLKREFTASNPGSVVQALSPLSVSNEAVLEMMAAQTFTAQESGSLLANKAEIDLLLRVAGTTQISEAIRADGARAGQGFILVAASHARLKVPRGHGGVRLPRRGLSVEELARIESAALLNARRA